MKVIVYVEGRSDKLSLELLLASLLERKRQKGIRIEFFEVKDGNRKKNVLTKVPLRAFSILHEPKTVVIALPDLYPKNVEFPHETAKELIDGIREIFKKILHDKRVDDSRLLDRFKVFCFKHDLEALLLAAYESLHSYMQMQTPSSWEKWEIPVENQNHDTPPKRIIEKLFEDCGKKYRDTLDAPKILNNAKYLVIAERCPQCFKPFIDFLESL
jgi:hypothetical protein